MIDGGIITTFIGSGRLIKSAIWSTREKIRMDIVIDITFIQTILVMIQKKFLKGKANKSM